MPTAPTPTVNGASEVFGLPLTTYVSTVIVDELATCLRIELHPCDPEWPLWAELEQLVPACSTYTGMAEFLNGIECVPEGIPPEWLTAMATEWDQLITHRNTTVTL